MKEITEREFMALEVTVLECKAMPYGCSTIFKDMEDNTYRRDENYSGCYRVLYWKY